MQINQHDPRALLEKELRACEPDASGAAGDETRLALQLSHSQVPPLLTLAHRWRIGRIGIDHAEDGGSDDEEQPDPLTVEQVEELLRLLLCDDELHLDGE